MEKKTIGNFISTLRKANGMTQKELAERLNVSDKTVSRWECDEGSPDLSLIPVIAEIFGVTCDELLRGERKTVADRSEIPAENEPTAKGIKQRRMIIKSAYAKFKTQTLAAAGVSVFGLIIALIANLAALKAVLGFFCGALFFVVGIIMQIVFTNQAFFKVDDDELSDLGELNIFKRNVIKLTEYSIGLTVCLIGFTFPLALVDAYVGLGASSMLLFGLIGSSAALIIYAVVCWFLNAHFLNSGVYTMTETEESIYRSYHRLKRNCALFLTALIAVTVLIQHLSTSIWGPYSIMKGTEFEDFESFKAYMEQDIPYETRYTNEYSGIETVHEPVPDSEIKYYDEFGNEITEEEAKRRTIEDKNGNVLCEYISRNETVCSISCTADDDMLPIKVCTYDDLEQARADVKVRNTVFTFIYITESSAVLAFYMLRRIKRRR